MNGGRIIIEEPGAKPVKGRGCAIWLLAIVVLLVVAASSMGFYTEWLWFRYDAGHPEVFTKTWSTRGTLWTFGFLAALAFIGLNAQLAVKGVVVYSSNQGTPQEFFAMKALAFLEKFGKKLGWVVALLVAFIVGDRASDAYQKLWLFQSGGDFGVKDPAYGMDLGFYVFKLPFYTYLLGAAIGVTVISLILALGARFGLAYLGRMAGARIGQNANRAQVTLLSALLLVLGGFALHLYRFSALTMESKQFTGPGYAASQGLAVASVLGWVAIVVGLIVIPTAWAGKPFRAVVWAYVLLAIAGFVGMGAYPGMVQVTRVGPDVIRVEGPYAKRAMAMTRYSFGLDKFDVKNFAVTAVPTSAELESAHTTLANMRLWDPGVAQSALDNLQTLKPYYDFNDVDIDRYEVNGERRVVMVSPRDIKLDGIAAASRSWVNDKLVYTHGFGVVMSPVNEATDTGRPGFFIKDMPPESVGNAPTVEQPRVYFSDYPAGAHERDEYLLLRTNQKEFDYPGETDHTYGWTGQRGVPVGGFLQKLAYSVQFGDMNLMLSSNITANSRILYRRSVVDRARAVYPFLKFDADPYIVVADKRLIWICDAYTVSDAIPYSQIAPGNLGMQSYVRNSVKIAIDAYSGDMTAYVIDPDEPILKAYRKVFPKLFTAKEEMPKDLQKHLRYAEDGFQYQAEVLAQYHVTDSDTFLRNQDAWEIPTERGRKGEGELIKPYYVQIRLPDTNRDAFMLIMPFCPRAKNNMIGWMAAHCDPEEFGKVLLFKFPTDTQTQGPSQMESTFNADPIVADINRQLNNDQSEIIPGNLLVIPVGSSILYVKPLFLQNKSARVTQIPELKKVILGLQNKVAVGNTYTEAFKKLFGDMPAAEPRVRVSEAKPTKPDASDGTKTLRINDARDVLKQMDDADAALKQGDLARYAELMKKAKARLKELTQ